MSASPLTIYLELGIGLLLLWPGLHSFFTESSNRIRRNFLLATILLSAGFTVDAAGRLVLYQKFFLSDLPFRAAELLFLAAALMLVYLGGIFPRRSGPWENIGRRARLFVLLVVLGLLGFALGALALLDIHYVYDRIYDPLPGTYYGAYGPVYYLIRLYMPLCLGLAAYEQRRFLTYHRRDPRRVHARYFITALGALGSASLLSTLLLLYGYENEFMALQAGMVLAFALFLRNMLENLSISYRANLIRNGALFTVYALSLLPLLYVIDGLLDWMEPNQSFLPAFVLCALFVGFYAAARFLGPRISRLIFKEQARMDESLADFNNRVLHLGDSGESDIPRQLTQFVDDLYGPRLFALYFRDIEDGAGEDEGIPGERLPESGGGLIQNKSCTRATDLQSIPPTVFPDELVAFLKRRRQAATAVADGQAGVDTDGGLIADLLVRAETEGDAASGEALTALAARGAELILPFFDDSRSGHTAGPEAILIMGILANGRPLDYSDYHLLWLLRAPTLLALKNQALLQDTTRLKEKLEEENRRITRRLNQSLASLSGGANGRGERPEPAFVFQPGGNLAQILSQAEMFAGQDSPVLITGETGTGKGEIARMIHGLSKRGGRFVTVNCSAIPADLIENELFGHVKGAYTGAGEAQDGLVARAADGTLFLDEIGELSPEGQTKLLRLVQEGAYEPIGSSETLHSTARFVFATNRDLEEDVQAGRFRSDLYFRISTFELRVPPLRERREDIPLLIDHFLGLAARNFHREQLTMTDRARELLTKYAWPGNVRELENLLLRTAVLSDRSELDEDQLPVMFRDELDFNRKKQQLERMAEEQSRLEKELLMEALQKSGGNQRAAAKILNISRGSLQYRLKQHGLS